MYWNVWHRLHRLWRDFWTIGKLLKFNQPMLWGYGLDFSRRTNSYSLSSRFVEQEHYLVWVPICKIPIRLEQDANSGKLLCRVEGLMSCSVPTTHKLSCGFWRIFRVMNIYVEAFRHGADIHTSTAMRVLLRKARGCDAKMIAVMLKLSTWVVYGISDFGLASNLRD